MPDTESPDSLFSTHVESLEFLPLVFGDNSKSLLSFIANPSGFDWHHGWVKTVGATISEIDEAALPIWNDRIDNNEIEAATRERIRRVIQILTRL